MIVSPCHAVLPVILFVSISQQLGNRISGSELRAHAVNFIENHLEQFEAQLFELGLHMIDKNEIPGLVEGQELIHTIIRLFYHRINSHYSLWSLLGAPYSVRSSLALV